MSEDLPTPAEGQRTVNRWGALVMGLLGLAAVPWGLAVGPDDFGRHTNGYAFAGLGAALFVFGVGAFVRLRPRPRPDDPGDSDR